MKNKHIKFRPDLKDKRLLYLLSKNYRFPVSFLAKKVGISKDSVNYRINRFWKERAIVGTNVIFNPFLAGIELFLVFLRFHNLTPAREKSILSFLIKNNQVVFILKLRGSWDLLLFVGARDPIEFDEFMTEFRNKYFGALDEFIFLVESKEYKFRQTPEVLYEGARIEPFSYKRNDSSFQKDFEVGPPIEISHGKVLKISKEEIKLLHCLNSDIRKSLTELSEELGISKDKLKKDISSLIERGFLQAFWPIVSADALGFQEHLIFVKFRRLEKEKDLERFFKGNKFVSHCVRIIGQWDMYLWIKVSNLDQFYEFIEKMRREFPEIISSIDSMLVEELIKWNTLCASNLLK